MTHTTLEVKQWGNSTGVIIPADITKQLGLRPGDAVEADIVKKERTDFFGIFKGVGPFKREDDEHKDIWE